MTQNQRKIAEETRAELVRRFPQTFCGKGQPKRPLKIGIYHDIRAAVPEISAQNLSLALRDYTTGPRYWGVMVAGAVRIDLDGNPAGIVTEAEAAAAARQELGFRSLWKLQRDHRNLRRAALNLVADENDLPEGTPDDTLINLETTVGAVRALNRAVGADGRGAVQ